jgi:hypothetical protein
VLTANFNEQSSEIERVWLVCKRKDGCDHNCDGNDASMKGSKSENAIAWYVLLTHIHTIPKVGITQKNFYFLLCCNKYFVFTA